MLFYLCTNFEKYIHMVFKVPWTPKSIHWCWFYSKWRNIIDPSIIFLYLKQIVYLLYHFDLLITSWRNQCLGALFFNIYLFLENLKSQKSSSCLLLESKWAEFFCIILMPYVIKKYSIYVIKFYLQIVWNKDLKI